MTQTSPTMVIPNSFERLTALEARVAYLEAENAELRRRLGLNSSQTAEQRWLS